MQSHNFSSYNHLGAFREIRNLSRLARAVNLRRPLGQGAGSLDGLPHPRDLPSHAGIGRRELVASSSSPQTPCAHDAESLRAHDTLEVIAKGNENGPFSGNLACRFRVQGNQSANRISAGRRGPHSALLDFAGVSSGSSEFPRQRVPPLPPLPDSPPSPISALPPTPVSVEARQRQNPKSPPSSQEQISSGYAQS